MQIYLGGEEVGGIRQEVRTSDDDFRGFRDFRSEPQARRGVYGTSDTRLKV